MPKLLRSAWMLGSMLAAAWPGTAAPAARDEAALRSCLAANLPQKSLAQDITLRQTDAAGGSRELVGSWYWQRGSDGHQAMLRLSAPADLAGAAYLFVTRKGKEDYYVYLPAVRKVRQVTGAGVAQSLFGSGLSAFDLKFLFSGLHGGRLTRMGAGYSGGRAVEQWRFLPAGNDPNVLYDRLDLTIDNGWCLPLKADLYGGVPWKRLELDPASIHQVNGRWAPGRAVLTDLRERSTTVIQLRNERVDIPLAPELFRPNRFYKAR
ncbi:outer membrane lipoprotein-sorting protein [Solimonas sp. K1W22B-7]|uniref:outer membrane lipoprotein-sorting protein n=1 Tax=Solimonas sp. K1W22B-7 TaxID=2303331 RepID=UPI000E3358DC|nr:outer membrane lipoprotein-sorting protein [Solimonas sp. K1W22B-7]AXQ29164.1 outer membrane lipoprotein-sorting protein [Solimonas sp. K1W22B-7]